MGGNMGVRGGSVKMISSCSAQAITLRSFALWSFLMWDLRRLAEAYGRTLDEESIRQLTTKTARALQRAGHRPGVELPVAMRTNERRCALQWIEYLSSEKKSIDDDVNVTEYAGMAMALVIVHALYPEREWEFMRRTVRGEFADIVLIGKDGEEFFIEASASAGEDPSRLAKKRAQLRRCTAAFKAACVTEFGPPRAAYEEL
jgi:hypothetical protein